MELDLSFFSPPYTLNRRNFNTTTESSPSQQKRNMLKRTYSESRTPNIDKLNAIRRKSLFNEKRDKANFTVNEFDDETIDVESSQSPKVRSRYLSKNENCYVVPSQWAADVTQVLNNETQIQSFKKIQCEDMPLNKWIEILSVKQIFSSAFGDKIILELEAGDLFLPHRYNNVFLDYIQNRMPTTEIDDRLKAKQAIIIPDFYIMYTGSQIINKFNVVSLIFEHRRPGKKSTEA